MSEYVEMVKRIGGLDLQPLADAHSRDMLHIVHALMGLSVEDRRRAYEAAGSVQQIVLMIEDDDPLIRKLTEKESE